MTPEDADICESTVQRAVAENTDLDKLIAIHRRMLGGRKNKRAREMREYSIQLLEDAKLARP